MERSQLRLGVCVLFNKYKDTQRDRWYGDNECWSVVRTNNLPASAKKFDGPPANSPSPFLPLLANEIFSTPLSNLSTLKSSISLSNQSSSESLLLIAHALFRTHHTRSSQTNGKTFGFSCLDCGENCTAILW